MVLVVCGAAAEIYIRNLEYTTSTTAPSRWWLSGTYGAQIIFELNGKNRAIMSQPDNNNSNSCNANKMHFGVILLLW